MTQQLYQIECEPTCAFMVRSHDKSEAKEIAKKHAKMVHGLDESDSNIEKMIKIV
jgi:predicted small metal-binding protein